jgi:peptide-methionine (S)-S-oxide reductase
MTADDTLQRATFAGGCFWCIEAAFEELHGVAEATSGYTGGTTDDPTYEEVCNGTTGHAEAVMVEYDPSALAYPDLLAVFFSVHDPTTRNRQGPDVGSQYRSAIYYHDDEQRRAAEAYIEELEAEGAFDDEIVTELEPLGTFYEAEPYHQDYFEKNPDQPYCVMYAEPKVQKVREKFADRVEH